MITELELSTSDKQRRLVVERCGNRCEAEIEVQVGTPTWTRCFRSGVEVHHLLTRARGGDLLDRVGETYHLAGLCPTHHRAAHGPGARAEDLLLDGYVTLEAGVLVYAGPDSYLSQRYGRAR